MATHFDPYHRWLAIPPQEQPPNHYRLLGLANFESDADVIEGAADRQMAHVRSHQTGKHADHVDGVLNEIAAAKRVLIDAEKKAEYDGQLRLKSAKPAAKAPPLAQPMSPTAGEAPLPPPVPLQGLSVAAPVARPAPPVSSPKSSKPQSSSMAPLLFALLGVGAIAVLLLVGGVGAFVWLRSSSQQVQVAIAPTPTVQPSPPTHIEPVANEPEVSPEEASDPPSTPIPENEPSIDESVDEPEETAEPTVEEPQVVEPEVKPTEETPPVEAAPTGPPAHIAALFSDLQPDARAAVPAAEVSKENAQRIAQVLRIDEARTPEAKAEVAQRMLKTARDGGRR